jgi:1-acyl-sn-glycerol-3-phosphate acyltransferase
VRALLSALFWIYLAVSLALFWIAVLPAWVLSLPFDPRRRFSHWYATLWATHYLALFPFWRVIVVGREHIRDDRPSILVANHQSAADIMLLYALRKHFKWVSKASLFRVPFLGWMMGMAGYVAVERGSVRSAARMLASCRRHIELGSSVLFFAEGTRSRTGQLGPFRDGAFRLAATTGAPVVPVVVEGTFGALPRGGWVFRHGGRVTLHVRVLEPVDPAIVDCDPTRLMQVVRERMGAEIVRLRAAPASS